MSFLQQSVLARNEQLKTRLSLLKRSLVDLNPEVTGRLIRVVGMTLEACGCSAPVGSMCKVVTSEGNATDAEVVGFSDDKLFLIPVADIQGLSPGARVVPSHESVQVEVGESLLGRVIDGGGQLLDDGADLLLSERQPLHGVKINPMMRSPVNTSLDVGVRSINGLLSIARGQRIGLFAGSGVGKSTLLGVMTRNTAADVVVVALVGERGREVREFIDLTLGEAGMSRAVVVATPADSSPVMRIHGALRATAIAEYFRSKGRNVLLLMDSLTRFAQAQREIALSIGEFPVSKGYPPSVFTNLPLLVERAGNSGEGSITAFYTVLVEDDDLGDPIADAARAILDGHIVLSREVAESGIYPAIDVEASISRSMVNVAEPQHLQDAQLFRKMFSTYYENRDLINVGAYQSGTDPNIDLAVSHLPHFHEYLSQNVDETAPFETSVSALRMLANNIESMRAL